jgi:hypothetical protein
MDKLIAIAKEIIKANPKALLSGSLALRLQGLQTRREPTDIDLWLPKGVRINTIDNMMIDSNSSHYEEITHHRESFIIGDVKIDIFQPASWCDYNPYTAISQGVNMVLAMEILKFKVEHAFDPYYEDTKLKHLQDLVFTLNAATNG